MMVPGPSGTPPPPYHEVPAKGSAFLNDLQPAAEDEKDAMVFSGNPGEEGEMSVKGQDEKFKVEVFDN